MLLRVQHCDWVADMALLSFPRQTLSREVRLHGLGLHSGTPVEVVLRPGSEGVRFLVEGTCSVASPYTVSDTRRSTSVGGARTVEHLMSALSGLGVTDIDVHLTTNELPAMDGSAAPFCDALVDGQVAPIGAREIIVPDRPVLIEEGGSWIEIGPGSGTWSYHYESADLWPYDLVVNRDVQTSRYRDSVAPARTFLRESDLSSLDDQDLARGIERSSALIVGRCGYLTRARMPDELVAHKLLDLIGDLFLFGIPATLLDVKAYRSGHSANTRAALAYASLCSHV